MTPAELGEARILLVDASATIRKVVELTFGDSPVRLLCVGNGAEALRELERFRPDVVLADAGMPEPSGYEICRRLKRSPRPVPVLLLVGTFEGLDEERARACGSDGHLMKPFEPHLLVERVSELLRGTDPAVPAADEPAPESPAGEARHPLSDEAVRAIARVVVERMSEDLVREIAAEVVPRLAEEIIRQRIRELEREEP